MSGRTIRVMIADDHLMVRKGLRLMLEEEGGSVELVGDAANGKEAVALVEHLQPDVVLMDIRMPEMDGIAALKQIRASWPGVAVVLLTTYNEDDLMLKGLQAGACGYLLKDTPVKTLLYAIQTAARGEMLLQPEIMARVLAHTHQDTRDEGTPAPKASVSRFPGGTELTRREREVLLGVAHGERSKEIALRLGITERTVRAYLTAIYTKLEVDSRAAAVAVALERGLLPRV
jgi:NarL family two-component system response regulator YdfI